MALSKLAEETLRRSGLSDQNITVVRLYGINKSYADFLRRFHGPVLSESVGNLMEHLSMRAGVTKELRDEVKRLAYILGPEGYKLTGSSTAHCGKMPA